jgi:hypothetical protein
MIRCLKLRPFEKNTLKGFVDFELTETGLVLHDCAWHRHSGGKEWIALPARSYTDAAGNAAWTPVIGFAPDATREEFQEQAIAAVHAVATHKSPASNLFSLMD